MCRFGETRKSEPGAWPEAALPIPFLSQGLQHLQMSVTLSGHLTRGVVTGWALRLPLVPGVLAGHGKEQSTRGGGTRRGCVPWTFLCLAVFGMCPSGYLGGSG